MATLFFDIGSTLADAASLDGELVFTPLPRVIETLDALPEVRKGIISNPGDDPADRARAEAALDKAFHGYFPDPSLINWGAKDSAAIFVSAIDKAGVAASDCVYVGEDAGERRSAAEAGMGVAPHPVFALAALQRRAVFWGRVALPAGRTLSELAALAGSIEFVPVHVPSERLVLGMATEDAAAMIARQGFPVDLRGQVGDTNAYLMRDDRPLPSMVALAAVPESDRQGIEAKRRAAAAFAYVSGAVAGFGNTVVSLGAAPRGVYLAAAAGTPIEEIHIPETGHGHTERLLPDPSLLQRPGEARMGGFLPAPPPGPASEAVHLVLQQHLTAATMRGHIERLAGAVPLRPGADDKIGSRHIESKDNAIVVDYLVDYFRDLGLGAERRCQSRHLMPIRTCRICSRSAPPRPSTACLPGKRSIGMRRRIHSRQTATGPSTPYFGLPRKIIGKGTSLSATQRYGAPPSRVWTAWPTSGAISRAFRSSPPAEISVNPLPDALTACASVSLPAAAVADRTRWPPIKTYAGSRS